MTHARAASRRLAPTSDPNVIPFIDVLLVLLIIFMVTAPQPTVDLHVDLPRAGVHRGPERPTIVAIREASGGYQVFVDDERVAVADIGARTLAHALSNNPAMAQEDVFAEARVFVRADQSTAYANVVDVMNSLRDARFAKVGIFAETAQN